MGYFLPADSSERLRALRAAMACAGDGPGAGGVPGGMVARVPTGWTAVDAALGGGMPCAGLHEWWGDLDDARAVCVQQAWNALLADDRARPGAHRHVVWVGRAAWPGAEDLVRGLRAAMRGMFGAPRVRAWPDARLFDRSVLVDVPAHDAGARLWAIEQAARCEGVCAVVADGRGFDLAATRRLQLSASDALLLSLRGPARARGAAPPSACSTRWRVERAVPQRAPWLGAWRSDRDGCDGSQRSVLRRFMDRLPAEPAWFVTLERAKGHAAQLDEPRTVHAVRPFEWEGVAVPPVPVAKAAARRAERSDCLRGERAAERLRRRRADALVVDATLAGGVAGTGDAADAAGVAGADTAAVHSMDGTVHETASRHPRGRARDRMTSRGERWVRMVEQGVEPGAAAGQPHPAALRAPRHGASRAG